MRLICNYSKNAVTKFKNTFMLKASIDKYIENNPNSMQIIHSRRHSTRQSKNSVIPKMLSMDLRKDISCYQGLDFNLITQQSCPSFIYENINLVNISRTRNNIFFSFSVTVKILFRPQSLCNFYS